MEVFSKCAALKFFAFSKRCFNSSSALMTQFDGRNASAWGYTPAYYWRKPGRAKARPSECSPLPRWRQFPFAWVPPPGLEARQKLEILRGVAPAALFQNGRCVGGREAATKLASKDSIGAAHWPPKAPAGAEGNLSRLPKINMRTEPESLSCKRNYPFACSLRDARLQGSTRLLSNVLPARSAYSFLVSRLFLPSLLLDILVQQALLSEMRTKTEASRTNQTPPLGGVSPNPQKAGRSHISATHVSAAELPEPFLAFILLRTYVYKGAMLIHE